MLPDTVQEIIDAGKVGRCKLIHYVTDRRFSIVGDWAEDMELCVGLNNLYCTDVICICNWQEEYWGCAVTPLEAMVIIHLLTSVYPHRIGESSETTCEHQATKCTHTTVHSFWNGNWCAGEREGKVRLCLNTNGQDKTEMSPLTAQKLTNALALTLTTLFSGDNRKKHEIKSVFEKMKRKVLIEDTDAA